MRTIGQTELRVPPLGFGAFKIGRNQAAKYPTSYDLPDERSVETLLNSVLDLGCTLIDTAPAYGLSEERIGRSIAHRRNEFTLSTKVGETFVGGKSTFDFSTQGVRQSLDRSLRHLKTDTLDIVFIHSDGNDQKILNETDTVSILRDYRSRGLIRAIGLSGKTMEGAMQAMDWADALMVEYHLEDTRQEPVIQHAAERDIAIFVKKGLSSGKLPAETAIRFVLANSAVTSLIVGGLNLAHFRHNWQTSCDVRK